ncbi:MAG: PQQ-dependent sugar dehydrogenase [Bacillota bacterium]
MDEMQKRPLAVAAATASPPPPLVRVPVKPADVYLEDGYRLEAVAVGLTYPAGLSFDSQGNVYIAEAGYSYGPAGTEGLGRILRLAPDGVMHEVAKDVPGPLTGVTWHRGALYAASGGFPGKIVRVDPDGSKQVLVDGLRSGGDHYTGKVVFDREGRMYFGVGTFTNSAVVGLDNFIFGWLPDHRYEHDVPARTYVLRGENYWSPDPFSLLDREPRVVQTGGFKPLGVRSYPGEVVQGNLYANGVVYCAEADGSKLRVVADGMRNPFGLGFSPDGRFYALDQGYDERGSRPVVGAPDCLWEVAPGGWYGWPDYVAGIPVTDPRWVTKGAPPTAPLLAEHPPIAGRPVLELPNHSASTRFDFSLREAFGHAGEMFISQLGTGMPVTARGGGLPGFGVVRANLETGKVTPFLVSRNPTYGGTGPQRPVDLKFDPSGEALYVLDFGTLSGNLAGIIPYALSGILWRVTRRTA